MGIVTVPKIKRYIQRCSNFSENTINSVFIALGFPKNGSWDELKFVSAELENCAKHGAAIGISGFIYYYETIAFFMANRTDIVSHMEHTAEEIGTDIISMVQNFGCFCHNNKPSPSEVGRALWDSQKNDDLTNLYNVFAWYALEEISNTWCRYLEENPA